MLHRSPERQGITGGVALIGDSWREVRAWHGGMVSSRQLALAVLNGQQARWWITPALSWVNGHRHPSPFNNVSARIVIEMSPKMEVNMQLSHLIWEAAFLSRPACIQESPAKAFLFFFPKRSDIIFTEMTCLRMPILSASQERCWKTRQTHRSSIQSRLIARKGAHIVFIHTSCLIAICSATMSGVVPQPWLGMWFCRWWQHGSSLTSMEEIFRGTQVAPIRFPLKGHGA